MIVTDIYEENGDLYWPDTLVGAKLDYGLRWDEWLANEGLDVFVSMVWGTIPSGLTSDGQTDADDISLINLEAVTAGIYCIYGIMTSVENGHAQKLPVQMNLKVMALC